MFVMEKMQGNVTFNDWIFLVNIKSIYTIYGVALQLYYFQLAAYFFLLSQKNRKEKMVTLYNKVPFVN